MSARFRSCWRGTPTVRPRRCDGTRVGSGSCSSSFRSTGAVAGSGQGGGRVGCLPSVYALVRSQRPSRWRGAGWRLANPELPARHAPSVPAGVAARARSRLRLYCRNRRFTNWLRETVAACSQVRHQRRSVRKAPICCGTTARGSDDLRRHENRQRPHRDGGREDDRQRRSDGTGSCRSSKSAGRPGYYRTGDSGALEHCCQVRRTVSFQIA